jgi:sugar lactone lactonase YvrE
MRRTGWRGTAALAITCALSGCGGGGGGGTPAPPAAPAPPPAPLPDTTPDPFLFLERLNAVRGTTTTTAAATISGINSAAAISVTGGEYSIGGATYTSADGTVTNGASVGVRTTASTTPGGVVEAVVTVGGVSATFRVTTSLDVTPPTAAIVFPPRIARTGGATVTVRGTAADASGPLAAVTVNGVPATTTNAFATWTAEVPLVPGPNTLTVVAEDGFLNVENAAAQATVHRNARFGSSSSIALDAANNRAFVTDGSADAVIVVDLATGFRTWFAEVAAPNLRRQEAAPVAIVFDSQRSRLLVLDGFSEAIVAIDLATRARSVLSGLSTSSVNRFQGPSDLALDNAGNRVLVTSTNPPRVVAVDLDSGARTILSDASTPNSTSLFTFPRAIAIDNARGRALVSDVTDNTIHTVDLGTGQRTILSSSTIPDLLEPLDSVLALEIDAANDRALVSQFGGRMRSIHLGSGQRTLFSPGSGGAQLIYGPTDLAIDAGAGRVIVLDNEMHGLAAVDLDDGTQSVLSPNNVAGGGVGLVAPFGMALDLANQRVLVSDEFLRSIVSVSLTTAMGTTVVNGAAGAAQFARPSALTLDGNRLFILDRGQPPTFPPAMISADLATGTRVVLSGPAAPNGVFPLHAPQQMALDVQRARLLVTERDERAVKAVDTMNGARAIVSSDSVPDPVNPFAEPYGILVDAQNGRALVANSRVGPGSELLAMNLATGQRTVIAIGTLGLMTGPKFLALDTARNRILVVDELRDTIFAVDLTTGAIGALTDVDDPDNPIDTPNAFAHDPASQVAYIVEGNFAALLAVDLVTGRRAYLSR